ncbi:MAG TPA: LPS assembly lipoprotein LptE [Solimonas sp.]|nr:LPS assembly lipoprotein LptE [Solimonas sp.]
MKTGIRDWGFGIREKLTGVFFSNPESRSARRECRRPWFLQWTSGRIPNPALWPALALVIALAACGFHAAGSRPLAEPLRSVYLEVIAPYRVSEPPLQASLRALLQRRGAKVAGSPAEALSLLRLSDLEERREVLSVGIDGKVLEFQLITSVSYVLLQGDQVLVPPDRISVTRDFSFRPQQVLAKEAEESRLREFIQNELAELVMLRLDARLSRQAPGPEVQPPQVVPAAPAS